MTTKLTKRIICAVLSVFAVLTIIGGCNSGEVYRLIKVKSFDGAVTVEREEKMNVFEGLQLISEDKVEVGDASLLELLADSDKHIVAEENTAFKLLSSGNEKSGNITVEMLYGKSLFTIDNKLPDGSTFEVYTPNATLSVRGTIFTVTYDPETNETSVKVMEGVVAVTTAEETEELTAGKTATITTDIINRNGQTEEAAETEVTEESVETEATQESVETEVTEESVETEVTEEAAETEVTEESVETEATEESVETEALEETADEQTKEVTEANKKILRMDSYSASGELDSYQTYEYDSDGNLVKCNYCNADGTLRIYDLFEYNSDGNKMKYSSCNPDGSVFSYTTYEYDSEGKIKKYTSYRDAETIDCYGTCEYDLSGSKMVEDCFYSQGMHRRIIHEYNSGGKEIKGTYYNDDGSIDAYYTNEYNTDGEIVKMNFYNADGTLYNFTTYKYNSDGDVIKSYSYASDGTLRSTAVYSY